MWTGHLVWMEAGDVDRSPGADGGGPTTKERRGDETAGT